MTLEKARELLQMQVSVGGDFDRNAARLILRDARLGHDQNAVDDLIRSFELESVFGLRPGTDFSNVV